ncbi:MAG: sigma-70 family RNA polymerase sigma factor [Cyanobacteria bacterium SBLK]|nr:sigma-70 family RNA polymerase sigma factor [Cyanobacteria bacterium SBLK]
MSELDERLRSLALEAQKHPSGSRMRRKAVECLLRTLQNSRKLCRPSVPTHLMGLYSEIYTIAKQNLFCYIFRKIDTYNPDKGEVLQWANFLLKRRFPEAIGEVTRSGKTLSWQNVQNMTLDDLDTAIARNGSSTPSEDNNLREYIEEDPDGIFHNAHVRNKPHATFQIIALKTLDGWSWQEISTELDVKIPTLSSFYQRNLKRFKPDFQSYLSR